MQFSYLKAVRTFEAYFQALLGQVRTAFRAVSVLLPSQYPVSYVHNWLVGAETFPGTLSVPGIILPVLFG